MTPVAHPNRRHSIGARAPFGAFRPGFRRTRTIAILATALVAGGISGTLSSAAAADAETAPRIAIETRGLVLRDIPFDVVVHGTGIEAPSELTLAFGGETLARGSLEPGGAFRASVRVSEGGTLRVESSGGDVAEAAVRAIPGWWSIGPPLLAIALALLLRQVVPALFAGVWLGASITGGGPFAGLLDTLRKYVVDALADPDHVSIVVFTLLLGGMVGVMSRSGATAAMVEALASRATTAARGQVTTWLLGVAVFFDDYANTLVVGNTMRPITDRLRISREKLAYIVDSTAAPIAAIALVSTWIGAEIGYIDAQLPEDSGLEPYGVFLRSIPYNFYPLFALAFGLAIAWSRRDFGPMAAAERRAEAGDVLRPGSEPIADFDNESLRPLPGRSAHWVQAVAPVAIVVAVTLGTLWATGTASLAADGVAASAGLRGVGDVIGAGDSYVALLYASFAGAAMAILLAVGGRTLRFGEAVTAWAQGMKSLVTAFVILTLAWAIGAVCEDLAAGAYVAEFLQAAISPVWLPAVVFLAAAAMAFGTGTSWGTMAILFPLVVPTAFEIFTSGGLDPQAAELAFAGSVAAVLSGAILGDHCSPISDTTVLSSMASGCDHIDHVRTQLPYALTVGGIVLAFGYGLTAIGTPVWLSIASGIAASIAVVLRFGRPIGGARRREKQAT